MLQSPDMDKQYKFQLIEEKIYKLWEKNNCFDPDKSKKNKTGKPFCIIMPPPNANDPLHIGHAMFVAIEDILIRYHRMLGDDTVWIPGTDHAGIETQFVYEKKLKKQGKSRFNFNREDLYQEIYKYVQENSGIAIDQMKKMGASADWSRYKFTLDKDIVEDVLNNFIKLHKNNLVYRDNKLVNFCPKCGTSFSNLEIKHAEQNSTLYYLKYGPLEVATTRPETKFADVALAVNPNDERYKKYIGQEIKYECIEGEKKLKVIADEAVDVKFGTGVLKITPYHDFTDFEIWGKNKDILPKPILGINNQGKLTKVAGKFSGLKAHIARDQVVKKLEEIKLITKINKNYQNTTSSCYKCNGQIEPLPLPQFFIKVKPMVEKSLKVLKENKIKIHGAGHDKILRHWLENLNDWNISRQIVWGIRIPVWYSIKDNPELEIIFISNNNAKIAGKIKNLLLHHKLEEIKKGLQELKAPANAKYIISAKSAGINYLQETDTFDTWFSSSQWPFITLKNTKPGDFGKYYPTSVMNTGYDILPFWVMRMIMMGLQIENIIPFNTVYLHGLVRDPKGQKMSKSKGNVINPLEIIEKYGSDALRMALVIRTTPGLDKSVGEADFKAARNLTNKLWNAANFAINISDKSTNLAKDKEFTQKMQELFARICGNMKSVKIGLAAETLYNEFWHWYCDQCIEDSKKGNLSQEALLSGLKTFLKLFHPFLPHVTEAIWQELFKKNLVDSKLLILENWPTNEK
jgi:valyl-tRNA synthetase